FRGEWENMGRNAEKDGEAPVKAGAEQSGGVENLAPNIVFSEVPLRHAALTGGEVDKVRAGGRMVPGAGVFPVWLARANRIEEVAEMQDGGVGAVVLE